MEAEGTTFCAPGFVHEVCWAFADDGRLLWPLTNQADTAQMEPLALLLLGKAYNSKGSRCRCRCPVEMSR